MIACYAQQGDKEAVMQLFNQMQMEGLNKEAVIALERMQQEGVTPNQLTHVAVLKGCVQLANVLLGMLVHACIIESSPKLDNFLCSNLVAMYVKCDSLKDAQNVMDDMDKADVVSWTSLIAGYSKTGQGKEALALFQKMKREGVEPDELATITALKACAAIGALQHGKQIHKNVMNSSLCCNVLVQNALMDMYAKCGCLNDASDVFTSMDGQDTLSWNVLISGYAQQGTGKQALQYFDKMLDEGVKPDATTLLAVLNACKHAGLVDQGHRLFESMSLKHGILPTMDHYACMVDLLCRAGQFEEAEDFILKMAVEPDAQVWMALLSGCRCRYHVETAIRAFTQVKKLNPALPGAYVTLANIFATAGMWKDLAKVRKEMDLLGFHKQVEHTHIEVEGEVFKFSTADRGHPRAKDIQAELKRLSHTMKEAGYEPNAYKRLESAGGDEGGDEEGDASCEHSERLAVAFGLISTSPGTPIRITKNLKICGDCHFAFRLVSDKEGREIHARDSSRFHHFEKGICSCGDYW